MPSIVDIYEALETLVEDCLPSDYKLLENAVLPEDNANNIYTKAYGIGIGGGSNPELIVKPNSGCENDFNIALVHKVTTTKGRVSRRNEQQKSIMEDLLSIKQCLENDPQLSGICAKAAMLDWSPVNFIDVERGKFYIVEGVVSTLFFE
jgi:hypothetical protein